MSATSETSVPANSADSSGFTHSAVSLVGTSPFSAQLGPLIEKYGLLLLLANLSPRQAADAGLLTIVTSGRTGATSSRSDALQQFLESRLRARLRGSDLCEVIWKPWATPWGQPLWKPRARVRTTSATATGLWRTMNTREKGGGEYSDPDKAMARLQSGHQVNLQDQVITAVWPTAAAARDFKSESATDEFTQRHWAHPRGKTLGMHALHTVWPTPTSLSGGSPTSNPPGNSRNNNEIRRHALWATAAAQPAGGTAEQFLERKREAVANGKQLGISLTDLNLQAQSSTGFSAPTEKRGALAPIFVSWLMGFPRSWVDCGMNISSKRKKR